MSELENKDEKRVKITIELPQRYYNALKERFNVYNDEIKSIEDYLIFYIENDPYVTQFIE